jgi:hypothetical protein
VRNKSRWRVIENHDQVVPALILKPLVAAAIDVQQHAWYGPPFTPFSVHAPLAFPRHQPSSVQSLLDPGVTELNLMLLHELLVEMQHVEVKILLSI